jgi:hypothetical protein
MNSMNEPNFTASQFFREARILDAVWVAFRDKSVWVASDADGGGALPVWSSYERASRFLARAQVPSQLQPVEVPLSLFLKRWVGTYGTEVSEFGLNWVAGHELVCVASREEVENGLSSQAHT